MSKRILKKKWQTRTIGKDTSVIPKGPYCYGIIGNTLVKKDENGNLVADPNGAILTDRCPYWSINEKRGRQENGYCSYGEVGDWQENRAGYWGMIWDQLKACGVNLDEENDIDFDDDVFGIPIELID